MPGAPKTADQIKQAIVLRDAGYSLASVAERTGISVSTLSRHFAKHGVTKGALSTEAVELARQQLLSDGAFVESLKHQAASVVLDDLAQFRMLREAVALTLNDVMADSTLPGHYRSRAIAALSTSVRLTQEMVRRALKIDEMPVEQGALPELTVRELTQDEIDRLRAEQAKDGVFDPPDIDIIDERIEQVTND